MIIRPSEFFDLKFYRWNNNNDFVYISGKSEGSVTQNGTKTLSNTESNEAPKVPYPKRIFFIVGNEFCERFNYHGIKSMC